MSFFERLLGDPEDKPLRPDATLVPNVELEPDTYDAKQDMGDADNAEKVARKAAK
jgi:hypothetical protein